MNIIFVTTCKPFLDEDSKIIQEQSILSWYKLNNYKNIKVKIIIIGDEKGIKQFCIDNKFINRNDVKKFLIFPYISEMLRIANEYASNDDVIIWSNSDIIYTYSLIDTILSFKNKINSNKYLLVGQRLDWKNYTKIRLINENIQKIIDESKLHVPCGIDYLIHSKESLINKFDKTLAMPAIIADQKILRSAMNSGINVYNCTNSIIAIHHDKGTENRNNTNFIKVRENNNKARGDYANIKDCTLISYYQNEIKFKKIPYESWFNNRFDEKYRAKLKQEEIETKENYKKNL